MISRFQHGHRDYSEALRWKSVNKFIYCEKYYLSHESNSDLYDKYDMID